MAFPGHRARDGGTGHHSGWRVSLGKNIYFIFLGSGRKNISVFQGMLSFSPRGLRRMRGVCLLYTALCLQQCGGVWVGDSGVGDGRVNNVHTGRVLR